MWLKLPGLNNGMNKSVSGHNTGLYDTKKMTAIFKYNVGFFFKTSKQGLHLLQNKFLQHVLYSEMTVT